MPYALTRLGFREEGGGTAVAGIDQVVPWSALRQMPPPLVVFVSVGQVAITMLGLEGANLTSLMPYSGKPAMCCQVLPPSLVMNNPPLSAAAKITLLSCGSADNETVRP